MSGEQTRAELERRVRAEMLLEELAKLNMTGVELDAFAAGADPGSGWTLAQCCEGPRGVLVRALTESTRQSRAAAIAWLLHGDPQRCFSMRCAGRDAPRELNGLVPGCGCERPDGTFECSCRPDDFPSSDIGGCDAPRWAGLGARPVRSITLEDLEEFVLTGRWRAQVRNGVRDRRLIAAGRRPMRHGGEYTVEQNVSLAKAIFGRLTLDQKVLKDPSVALTKDVKRPRRRPTGLDERHIVDLHRSVRTGSSTDVELDQAVIDTGTLAGTRAGGLVSLSMCDLLVDTSCLMLREKGGTDLPQPVPGRLLADLLRIALSRGPFEELRAQWSLDALVDAVLRGEVIPPGDAAVFYMRRGTPMTARHLDTLFNRLRRDLSWAAERNLRFHDLRRTGARNIERVSGSRAVAEAFLRHSTSQASDLYIAASMDEVRAAVETYAVAYYQARDVAVAGDRRPHRGY